MPVVQSMIWWRKTTSLLICSGVWPTFVSKIDPEKSAKTHSNNVKVGQTPEQINSLSKRSRQVTEKEFTYHEKITARFECDFYFAHQYHTWERGLNEHTNSLFHQHFPKSTDFKEVSAKGVRHSVDRLNNRPRKTLAIKTPTALMQKEMAALAA